MFVACHVRDRSALTADTRVLSLHFYSSNKNERERVRERGLLLLIFTEGGCSYCTCTLARFSPHQ